MNKGNYKERYYDPWKEQTFSQPQNGKGFLYQMYRARRKPMLHRKISNEDSAHHFRPGRESRPETHKDEKPETMTKEFMEID